MSAQAQIAIAPTFLEALSKLPKAQEKKARDFLQKFRENPLHNSINYESIHGMRDPKVRTVRIDQAYRAIVVHPPKGDVYLLVWVDHHDEAMAWARNKVFEVNPVIGAIQVYDMSAVTKTASERPASASVSHQKHLLDASSDDDLLLCGVPQPLLPAVRAVITEAELDAVARHLPGEAADALLMLAAGSSLDEALTEAGSKKERPATKVDPQDFVAALAQSASKRRFVMIESETQLLEMLAAPLEQWRVFLHPSQRALVETRANGPVVVRGGPGTGKTVVAMHRARYLASKIFTASDDRLLVTTFTRNLAVDMDRHLRAICGDERDRIEVTNLHKWAKSFLGAQGLNVRVATPEAQRDAWHEALRRRGKLTYAESFFRDEWKYIVQGGEVTSRDEYFRARRSGRGTALSRAQRAEVWEVLAAYRASLDASSLMEYADMVRECRKFLEKPENRNSVHYRAVIADEVQDFTLTDLRLLRALGPLGPNDMFLVGDAHQRIYGPSTTLSAAGIDVRGRSKQLKLNYRTTQEIRDWAVGLVEGRAVDDLDEGEDSLKGYRSLRNGEAPTQRLLASAREEYNFVVEVVKGWLSNGPAEEICLVARTQESLDGCRAALGDAGIPTLQIQTDAQESAGRGVRLATMHRVKGLEFPRVLIAGVQRGLVPFVLAGDYADESAREDHDQQERRLLFVATTRARDELVVTGHGHASSFFEKPNSGASQLPKKNATAKRG